MNLLQALDRLFEKTEVRRPSTQLSTEFSVNSDLQPRERATQLDPENAGGGQELVSEQAFPSLAQSWSFDEEGHLSIVSCHPANPVAL